MRCSVVISEDRKIIGIVTDGNLRRYLSKKKSHLNDKIYKCVNFSPTIVKTKTKAYDVINLVKGDYRLLSGIPVINDDEKLIGLITQQQIIDYGM